MRRIWNLGMVGLALVLGGCQAFFDDQKGLLGALPAGHMVARGGLMTCPPASPEQAPSAPLQPGERAPEQPAQPGAEQPGPAGDAFAQAPPAGTEAPASFNPNMFGDFSGIIGVQIVPLPAPRVLKGPQSEFPTIATTTYGRVLIPSSSGFKIADDESPRPTDRIYFGYNFYNNVGSGLNGPDIPSMDEHRETIGFEKTFLNGEASIGMRLPFVELGGAAGDDNSDFGDLSIIFKFALFDDHQTGNLLSGGLVVTAPTGTNVDVTTINPTLLQAINAGTPVGNINIYNFPVLNLAAAGPVEQIHPALLQPWVGYIWNWNQFYLHGFCSLEVPTDARFIMLLSNDVGIGYWLYQNRSQGLLTGVAPTFEVHVNDPLNHRGALTQPLGLADEVDLTAGVHMLLGRRSSLGVAVGTPVTGPRPFAVESIVQLNVRY